MARSPGGSPSDMHLQRVLDASTWLLSVRMKALDHLGSGRSCATATLVGEGDVKRWCMEDATHWNHVLSTRPMTCGASLEASMPNNRRLVANGLGMTSVFDEYGTEPDARRILENEPSDAYYFGCAPVEMRLIDHRRVLLNGQENPRSLLQLSSPTALAAAFHYWDTVAASVTRCYRGTDRPVELTARELRILELLAEGLSDGAIAATLGLSVRTIRTDVAAAMQTLGANTRFELGYAAPGLLEHGLEGCATGLDATQPSVGRQ